VRCVSRQFQKKSIHQRTLSWGEREERKSESCYLPPPPNHLRPHGLPASSGPGEPPVPMRHTVCINDPSLPECHVCDNQPDHRFEAKEQESDMQKRKFKCNITGCRMAVKRQDHLERHTRIHSKEKSYVCWVPECHRAFTRCDNLKVHCIKTYTKRGGCNRYVATLDETSPDYDSEFRGQLTFDGRPLRLSASTSFVSEGTPQQP
jgi:hypothetical protein